MYAKSQCYLTTGCQSFNLSSLPLAITFLKRTPERDESEGEEGANDFPNVSYLSKSQMVLWWTFHKYNKSHFSPVGLPVSNRGGEGGPQHWTKMKKAMVQVSVHIYSGAALKLCSGQALCQLPCLFCPVLASWSWGGRIFPEGKQPTPCPTLLLGQLCQAGFSLTSFLLDAWGTSCQIISLGSSPSYLPFPDQPWAHQRESGGLPSFPSAGNALPELLLWARD